MEDIGCSAAVWNRGGVTLNESVLVHEAQQLTDLGASPHFVVYGAVDSADHAQAALEQECPSWVGPTGVRSSTLLVVGVSPESHKSWIAYGSAWHGALDQHFNRIRVEDMNPYFKNKEWGLGMVHGGDALVGRLKAAQDETLHPAPPVDLKPVGHAVEVGIFAVVFLVTFAAFSWLFARIRRAKRETAEAQQLAVTTRNQVAEMVQKLDAAVETCPAERKNVAAATRDQISESFARYSNSEKANPDTPKLGKSEYLAIAAIYTEIKNSVIKLNDYIADIHAPEKVHRPSSGRPTYRAVPRPTSAEHSVVVNTTAPSDSFGSGFTGGVLGGMIGSELGHRNDDSPRYDPPAPSWDPPSSSSSDSGGGGGSDWSSSSDSGSGGGSDFGSSSDSGGGGGGDF